MYRGIIALAIIALLLVYPATAVEEARASPMLAAAFIVGAIVGGIIGYWKGVQQAEIQKAYEQYRNDTDTYTRVLREIYTTSWEAIIVQLEDSHNLFFNKTYNYYVRWAESIASSVCSANKTSLSDQDLDPILYDLAVGLGNHMERIAGSLVDLYDHAVGISQMRADAGLSDKLNWFVVRKNGTKDWTYAAVRSNGDITWSWGSTTYADAPSGVLLSSPGVALVDLRVDGSRSTNYTALKSLIANPSPANIYIAFDFDNAAAAAWVADGFIVVRNGTGSPVNLTDKVRWLVHDYKLLYHNVKENANLYCQSLAESGGEPIPPPSISLPYDYDTLNQMDPASRMQLYYAYLYYLGEVNWSQVQNLTADAVYGLPNQTIRINGSVDLDGDGVPDYQGVFIPVNIPFPLVFTVGNVSGIAGIWYYYDENGTLRIINLQLQPLPASYEIVEELGSGQFLIQYTSGNKTYTVVAVDLDGDGTPDYIVPSITPQEIATVQYDWGTGSYSYQPVPSIVIGPQPADEWSTIRLQQAGVLEPPSGSGTGLLDAISGWWNGLSLPYKLVVLAAGFFLFAVVFLRR